MSDVESESRTGGPQPEEEAPEVLTYEGSRVPFYVVLIWLAFLIWGVAYILRWIPESWREWFAR